MTDNPSSAPCSRVLASTFWAPCMLECCCYRCDVTGHNSFVSTFTAFAFARHQSVQVLSVSCVLQHEVMVAAANL